MIPIVSTTTFKLGAYQVRCAPKDGSSHMALYTVTYKGKIVGTQMSMPTLEDCKRMSHPPEPVPFWNGKFAGAKRGRPTREEQARKRAAAQQEIRDSYVPGEDG